MKDLRDFLFDGTEESPSEKFERLSKGKSRSEKRRLEKQILRPDKLPPYAGPKPRERTELEDLAIMIILANKEDFNLFKKYFPLAKSKYKYVALRNLRLLKEFLNLLESGQLQYDREKNKLKIV